MVAKIGSCFTLAKQNNGEYSQFVTEFKSVSVWWREEEKRLKQWRIRNIGLLGESTWPVTPPWSTMPSSHFSWSLHCYTRGAPQDTRGESTVSNCKCNRLDTLDACDCCVTELLGAHSSVWVHIRCMPASLLLQHSSCLPYLLTFSLTLIIIIKYDDVIFFYFAESLRKLEGEWDRVRKSKLKWKKECRKETTLHLMSVLSSSLWHIL